MWETRRLAVMLLVCGQSLYLIALGQHPQSLSLCAFSLLEWWAVKETKADLKKSSGYTQNTVVCAILSLTKLADIFVHEICFFVVFFCTKCAYEDKEHDKVLWLLITRVFFCPLVLINQAKLQSVQNHLFIFWNVARNGFLLEIL